MEMTPASPAADDPTGAAAAGSIPATLIDAATLAARVDALAAEIAAALPADFTLVVVLNGAFVFAADLVRALHRHGAAPRVGFVTASSYGDGTRSSGVVTVTGGAGLAVGGQHVLLVDDILESGQTLGVLRARLTADGAASVRIAVLLDKPGRRAVPAAVDFTGFRCPDRFVVGYGMDCAGRWRELPFVGVMDAQAAPSPPKG